MGLSYRLSRVISRTIGGSIRQYGGHTGRCRNGRCSRDKAPRFTRFFRAFRLKITFPKPNHLLGFTLGFNSRLEGLTGRTSE